MCSVLCDEKLMRFESMDSLMPSDFSALRECILGDTYFNHTLLLISGKYKMSVLYALFHIDIMRYGEIKRLLWAKSRINH